MDSKKRQVYVRKGVVHVCFAGKLYGPRQDSTRKSAINAGNEVMVSTDGEGGCHVELVRKRSGKPHTESWVEITFDKRKPAKKLVRKRASKKTRPMPSTPAKAKYVEREPVAFGTNILDMLED